MEITGPVSPLQCVGLGMRRIAGMQTGNEGEKHLAADSLCHVGHSIPYGIVYICQGLRLPSVMGKAGTSSEIGVHSLQGHRVLQSGQLLPSKSTRSKANALAKHLFPCRHEYQMNTVLCLSYGRHITAQRLPEKLTFRSWASVAEFSVSIFLLLL